jgi:hypothetical protein
MNIEKTEYKDFLAEVTDGRLRVWHYNHEEDHCEGQSEVRGVRSYFCWRWGLKAETGTDWHGGGAAGADVHAITVSEIREMLQFTDSRDWDQIETAAKEWLESVGKTVSYCNTIKDGVIISYEQEGSDDREEHMNDEDLAAMWAWAVKNDKFA